MHPKFIPIEIQGHHGQWYAEDPAGDNWAPQVFWGEWLFIFGELWNTGNYFQGFGEQAHSLGDLGSPAKK